MKKTYLRIHKLTLLLAVCLFSINSYCSTSDTLRFGLIKYKSLDDFKATYGPIVDYLAKKSGKVPYYEIVNDDELGYKLNDNEFDIGIFKPFPYLNSKTNFPNLEVFASHSVNDQDRYTGVIVVKKESGIIDISDLENKVIMFVKETSTSGYRIPKGIFREHDFDIDSSFLRYSFSGSHDLSLDSLVAGKVDAIAINKKNLLDYQKSKGANEFYILEEYEIPYNAYVFSPHLDSSFRQKIKQIMFQAHMDPGARSLFNNKLGIDKWYPCNDDNYNQLRRYLGIVRIKPTINLTFSVNENAKNYLEAQGDILPALEEDIIDLLRKTSRFEKVLSSHSFESDINLKISISIIDRENETIYCKISLNENNVKKMEIRGANIISKLPILIKDAVLINTPIFAQLYKNNRGWFITYGENDGIYLSSYLFFLNSVEGSESIVEVDHIKEITPLNIYFENSDKFRKNSFVTINYKRGVDDESQNGNSNFGNLFDIDVDINWDIVGIILAVLTGSIGIYYTFRKKKRFRNMLYQTNDLLKEYVEGKYILDNKVIEQKQRISRSLEIGKINENQFLILKHRMEEIEKIIENGVFDIKGLSPELINKINDILADGIITEKEYGQLMKIFHQKKHSKDNL